MKFIRQRLTFANVMSSIAVFLILGGATAFAASQLAKNSVGTKQLKKNAVTTAKIKNSAVTTNKIKDGAVTSSKVNLSTLGKVPSADTATSAGNANTVGGNSLVRFSFNHPSPVGDTQILNLDGLQLIVNCPAGGVTLTARTTVNDGEVSAENTNATTNPATFSYGQFDDTFNVGDNFVATGTDHTDILGRLGYTGGDLHEVEVFWHEEDSIGGSDCILNGYAIGS